MLKNNLYLIAENFKHHIVHSTTDYISQCIKNSVTISHPPEEFNRIPGHFLDTFGGIPKLETAYNADSLKLELYLMSLMQRMSDSIIHHISAEGSLYYSARYKAGNAVCATYHQPPSFMDKIIPDKTFLQYLDGIGVVGKNQIEYFAHFLPEKSIFWTPLGINVEYFAPCIYEKKHAVLFLGNWLRDFETFIATIRLLVEEDPHLEFWVVTPEDKWCLFPEFEQIKFFCNLPDAELIHLLQQAKTLLFPVLDATANSAVLEAMACGTVIITNEMMKENGYLTDNSALFVKDSSHNSFAEKTLEIVSDTKKREKIAQLALCRVCDTFDWKHVVKRYYHMYENIV